MKTVAFLCAVVMLLAILPMAEAVAAGEPAVGIDINGDAELLAQAAEMGWPGDGSAADPIVIEKMNFTAAYAQSAVYIGNTTLHLRLQDCIFENQSSAILLFASSNISLQGCQFRRCYLGLGGILAQNIEINGSTFSCTLGAVVLVNCHGLDLTENTMFVQPGENNTFLSGLSLQNCSDIYAYQNWFHNGTNSLSYCSNVSIYACFFQDCEAGLEIAESDKITLGNSTFTDGSNAVVMSDNSTNVTMAYNEMNGCA
ncbi:MAG: right-handed parallel beta-helix repeat-containing protein, partial [Methanomassiliicoccales archaeon]